MPNHDVSAGAPARARQRIQQWPDLWNRTVNDYMTDPAVHFEENSDLVNICDFLLKNIFRRVPVTSDGKLIGIISVKDVLNSVLQLRQEKVGSTD